MIRARRSSWRSIGEPGDDSALGDEIAAAQPDDDFDARVTAIAFLRERGSDLPRVVVGGYALERRLGGGGFGRVYLATQPGLGRRVAIKLLHRHRVAPEASWLRREANALAQLNHPNAVQVFEIGESEAGTFIVMEYVDGPSLRQWQVERGWAEIVGAYHQAGLGLAAAHARGILHLDFKPSNVLVGHDGRVRVVDFGLAGGPGLVPGSDSSSTSAELGGRTRAAGGTPGYASPEQLRGGEVDARSDQFSFCAALWEALHDTLPYTRAQITAMGDHPRRAARPIIGGSRAPRWLDRALRRGLAAVPERRWASMRALLEALTASPVARHRAPLVWLAITATAIAPLLAGVGGPATEHCADVASELAPEWDTRRREAVVAALVGAEHTTRGGPARAIVERLDHHATQLHDDAFAACALIGASPVTASEHYLTQRGCLRRHRDRFERMVDLVVHGGPAAATRADLLIDELGTPGDCRDARAPGLRSHDHDLDTDLDLARLDLAAGRHADAEDRTARALVLAEPIGDASAVAEARLLRGTIRAARGHIDEALVDLDASGLEALALGRDDLAAQSWRRAAWLAADAHEDLVRADRWSRLARAAVERLGDPPRANADQLDTEGLLLRLAGDPEGAEERHRAALRELDRVIPEDDPRHLSTWLLLAHAVADAGRTEDASALYERALGLAQTRLGPSHREVASILLARALVTRTHAEPTGDPPTLAALAADLDRAAEILGADLGDNHTTLASILTLNAELVLVLGDLPRAEALARRAWSLQQASLPTRHSERGSALAVLARVELARGDWSRALELHQRYASEREAVASDAELAAIDNNLGWLSCRLDRCDEARRHYTRALGRGDALQRAYAAAGLGHVALALAATDDAQHRLTAALAQTRALGDDAPADLIAEAQWHLAEARITLGESPAQVRPLVGDALAYYRASGSDPLALARLERLAREP